ncbi:MAG: NINE protein [Bradymonadaceae bacterium]|nr:NINE protein [Lujinxingiaceae bacterium]
MKSKGTAALLAFLLGGFGVHKFYLGQSGQGVMYVLFCWTFIPAVIALIETFVYLMMSEQEFNKRYNQQYLPAYAGAGAQMGQNVTINLGSEQLKGLTGPVAPARNVLEELQKLKELHVAGVLTDEEFTVQKQRMLM